MAPTKALLCVKDLGFRYQGAAQAALEGVSFAIPEGRTTAVVGLSGSGKTSMLHLLGLLIEESYTGSIVYRGNGRDDDYASLDRHERASLRLRHFGFVLQNSYMLPHFRCVDNIAMPLAVQGWGRRERLDKANELLERADPSGKLARRAQDPAGNVSGGEKQRMAVLRAIIHNPRLIFADEPFSNLDRLNTRLTLDLLNAWKTGRLHPSEGPSSEVSRTLVFVSHNIRLSHKVAKSYLALRAGSLVEGRRLTRTDAPTARDLAGMIHRPPTHPIGTQR